MKAPNEKFVSARRRNERARRPFDFAQGRCATGTEIQQRNLVARNELVYRNAKRMFSCAANLLVSDSL